MSNIRPNATATQGWFECLVLRGPGCVGRQSPARRQEHRMQIERWTSSSKGRSRSVAYGGVIWTVANAIDTSAAFEAQAIESLSMLDAHLTEAGSARTHLLSLQVIVSNIEDRGTFDRLWQEWIGSNPEHWPQRACFQSALAPGLLVELVAVAAPRSAGQVAHAATPANAN